MAGARVQGNQKWTRIEGGHGAAFFAIDWGVEVRIDSFEVKRLHGNLTKKINFNPDLNLLVGINGCGKTSILNCMGWLLTPDFARLSTTQFQSLHLSFSHESKKYEIKVTQRDDVLLYEVNGGGFNGATIDVRLLRVPAKIQSDVEAETLRARYAQLGPERHEIDVWKFVQSLPGPLSISLDRTISAELDGVALFDPVVRPKHDRSTRSPLVRVADVTRSRYAAYREKVNSLNESLKSKLVLLAFHHPFSAVEERSGIGVTIEDIQSLESKLSALLYSSLGRDDTVANRIGEYFTEAKQFLKFGHDKDVVTYFNVQFRQIYALADEFKLFEKNSNNAYEALGSYLAALNTFFTESGKAIGFNEQDGTLGFRFIGPQGRASGAYLPLERLSSGEKQVIILLTFLAFIAKRRHVFIIDEPELSLHPKWQREFVGAMLSQAPDGAQIILATHSPEIVANYRSSCLVLDA